MPEYLQRETNRNVEPSTHENMQNQAIRRRFTTKPPNALASVIARSGSKITRTHPNSVSDNEVNDLKKDDSQKNDSVAERRGYSMQVNEFFPDLRNRNAETAILCVTLREIYQSKDNRHHRVWIPISICSKLLDLLEKTAISDPDHSISSQKSNSKDYDPTLLIPIILQDNDVKKSLEIENDEKSVRLRSYMTAPLKDKYVEGDVIEMIVLYPQLMSRLIRFLKDTVIRYMPLIEHRFPSLYSYSGERRFYFDCRSSRWGVRLQVSQVTDRHRNTIGVPLDSLMQFRDQINTVLEKLNVFTIDSNDEPRQYNNAAPKKRNNRKTNVSRRSRTRNSTGYRKDSKGKIKTDIVDDEAKDDKINLDHVNPIDLTSVPVVQVH